MFSSSNLGHCHPYITEKVVEQMRRLVMANLSTHNALWGPFAEMMCRRFGYDKIIAMTSGTEAADTACKIARKWGIRVKGIPADSCIILGIGSSYHGLGSGVWGLMDGSSSRTDYGLDSKSVMNVNPGTGESLAYLDLEAMARCMREHSGRVAAVIMECIHGTSRSVDDEMAYARGVYDLCRAHNVLFIADEVRQGAGKTGKFLSYQHIDGDFKPDITTMGKSITGGFYPQSFILGTSVVMDLVGSYQMASTFGFTPLAIAAAAATIEVIDNDRLMSRAEELGAKWKSIVQRWNSPKVDYVAVLGADSNLYFKGISGPRVAALCIQRGLFTYPDVNGLRLSFAMNMTDETLEKGAAIIKQALDEEDQFGDIPGEVFEDLPKYSAVGV